MLLSSINGQRGGTSFSAGLMASVGLDRGTLETHMSGQLSMLLQDIAATAVSPQEMHSSTVQVHQFQGRSWPVPGTRSRQVVKVFRCSGGSYCGNMQGHRSVQEVSHVP